jgi:hypothetical protein
LQLQRRSGIEIDGDVIWRDFGRFAGSICASSVAGVVYSFAHIQRDLLRTEARTVTIPERHFELQALQERNSTVGYVFQGIQFVCVVFALNKLVLRVSDHASHSYYNHARDFDFRRTFDFRDCIGEYRLYYLVRSMNGIALMFGVLTFLSFVVLSAFTAERAVLLRQASTSFSTTDHAKILQHLDANETNVSIISSSRLFLYAVTLVFIFSKFLLYFPACIVMFHRVHRRLAGIIAEMGHRPHHGDVLLPFEFSRQAAHGDDSGPGAAESTQTQIEMPIGEARQFLGELSSAATAQRIKFSACLAISLVALLLLATFSVTFAVARTGRRSTGCQSDCESCQFISFLIRTWILFTPEFRPVLFSVNFALPQIVSLWLMMSRDDRQMMMQPRKFRSDLQTTDGNDRNSVLRNHRLRMGIEMK